MNYEIARAAHAGLYIVLVFGITVLFGNDIKALIWRIKMRNRLKARRNLEKESRLGMHLNMLVKTTVSAKLTGNHLLVLSGTIFAGVLIAGIRSFELIYALFFAALIAVMPYFLLRIRLENLRHEASFEGEAFITSLLSKYRMTSFNMQRALEILMEDEKMPKLCMKLLYPVIMEARSTGDSERIHRAFDEFNFAINTNWSRMASYNMALSFTTGIDVTNALEDIMLQLREARTLSEERKRLNSESNRLVMFMVPTAYIMSLFLAVKYAGVSMPTVIRNQFLTKEGFALFIFIVFMFLLNAALLKALENRRFDY